jgi:protein involved in polysaccharide export with SLBB domain
MFTVLGRDFISGIKPAVLAGLAIALAAPSVALAQSSGRTGAQLRNLSEESTAELLQSLLPTPQSKQDAVSTDEELLEQLLDIEAEEEEEELRIAGGETLLITANFDDERFFVDERFADSRSINEALVERDEALVDFSSDIYRAKLLGRNIFRLQPDGVLELPGVASIPLLGLSEEEAALRLLAEPMLAPLAIEVRVLPVRLPGFDSLTRFGSYLFENAPTTFVPVTDIPIPAGYILGPGDSIFISLYGNENAFVELDVLRDGTITFPRIGPRPVAGMGLAELRNQIKEWVSSELLGTNVSVTLGTLKSIRVFSLGDVRRPGSYEVGGLSTMTNALFAGGGVQEIGSLRAVELRRSGKLINTFDLYDLLLKGDSSGDARLRSGDVIFVPGVKMSVGITGSVRRPAIYELKDERTVGELIGLAGGQIAKSDPRRVRLERYDQELGRRILTLDLRNSEDLSTRLRDGDLLTIPSLVDEVENAVFLSGHVDHPGAYAWTPGMTISDLLPSESYLGPRADVNYLLIRGEEGPNRRIEVRSADLSAALKSAGSAADIPLHNRDTVYAFELGVSRSTEVAKVIAELEVQSSSQQQIPVVNIGGAVHAPGQYPLEPGMRISDLLRAGGNMTESAYAIDAELARYPVGASGDRETELIKIDLAGVLVSNQAADVALRPGDAFIVKVIPNWEEQFIVTLEGEVRFPGEYAVRPGETLSSAIGRAGGLTDLAFVQGAVFTRETLRDREAEHLEILATRLEADVAALALQVVQAGAVSGGVGLGGGGGDAASALSLGQGLLAQIRGAEPTGRLVINLQSVLDNPYDTAVDIALRPGDTLAVPRRAQEVTVLGEVQFPTSHFYQPGLKRSSYVDSSGGGLKRSSYVDSSGGYTVRADKGRVYVVRANGQVIGVGGSRWFSGKKATINPGDTIVVPLDTDRVPSLIQWASITQILFNLALAAAAVNSF